MTIRFSTIFLAILAVGNADTLTFRNGHAITGSWVGADAQQVNFLVNDQVRMFPRAEVAQVDFGESQVAAVQGRPRTATPAPAPASAFEQVAGGIRFRVEKCERHDTREVVCSFTAEALSKDTDLLIGQGSFIVDSKGIKQNPMLKVLGSASNGDRGASAAGTLLVQNVPVEGKLNFGGAEAGVDRVALLSFDYKVDPNPWAIVVFRNIPLLPGN